MSGDDVYRRIENVDWTKERAAEFGAILAPCVAAFGPLADTLRRFNKTMSERKRAGDV